MEQALETLNMKLLAFLATVDIMLAGGDKSGNTTGQVVA
jgi:hypothetical protein